MAFWGTDRGLVIHALGPLCFGNSLRETGEGVDELLGFQFWELWFNLLNAKCNK